jgi:hypothetical protein
VLTVGGIDNVPNRLEQPSNANPLMVFSLGAEDKSAALKPVQPLKAAKLIFSKFKADAKFKAAIEEQFKNALLSIVCTLLGIVMIPLSDVSPAKADCPIFSKLDAYIKFAVVRLVHAWNAIFAIFVKLVALVKLIEFRLVQAENAALDILVSCGGIMIVPPML